MIIWNIFNSRTFWFLRGLALAHRLKFWKIIMWTSKFDCGLIVKWFLFLWESRSLKILFSCNQKFQFNIYLKCWAWQHFLKFFRQDFTQKSVLKNAIGVATKKLFQRKFKKLLSPTVIGTNLCTPRVPNTQNSRIADLCSSVKIWWSPWATLNFAVSKF
jgi:hypothetical protein